MSTEDQQPTWLYDLLVWGFTIIFDLFFRQILPRGAYRIPKKGPVIFVAAPHANQFVDPMMLMQQVKFSSGRRISFLVAESSKKMKFIGFASRATAAIGVERAQDNLVKGSGSVYIKDDDPLHIYGKGTRFTAEAMDGGYLGLPSMGMTDISSVVSDTELIIRKEFKSKGAIELLKRGTTYKLAARVDHSDMYHRVFHHLHTGGCLGIFPEGGSHDRPNLLPLKAGVAIMALGAIAENRDCNVRIIPCGMNYFHPHKFRSRAVIEFGAPMEVPSELVDQYIAGGDKRKKAVQTLLDNITIALKTVTVTCQDYDTLMAIQAARRLYLPNDKQLPLPVVVEITRRFAEGYNHFKDDTRIVHLRDSVAHYNRQLSDLGIKDHQVETASLSPQIVIGKLLYRTSKLLVLLIFSLPGAILFSPVFIATKRISKQKAAKALKASSVKIAAKDVLATWKLLVAMGLTPLLYTIYALLATWLSYRYQLVPRTWKYLVMVTIGSYVVLPAITYAALVIGETGMDIFKSLRPLALALNPTHKNTLEKLKATRVGLINEVTQLVNTLGPELYPNFSQDRLWKGNNREKENPDVNGNYSSRSNASSSKRNRTDSNVSLASYNSDIESAAISRVNSEFNLADIPIFSSCHNSSSSGQQSPSSSLGHSRRSSETSSIDGDSYVTIEKASGRDNFNAEITKRIRGAFAERQNRDEN